MENGAVLSSAAADEADSNDDEADNNDNNSYNNIPRRLRSRSESPVAHHLYQSTRSV